MMGQEALTLRVRTLRGPKTFNALIVGFLLIIIPQVLSLKYGGVDIRPEVAKTLTLGHRLKGESLSKSELQVFDGKLPCVVERPFDLDNEKWCDNMVQKLGDVMIEYDARDRGEDGNVLLETYECKLSEYLAALAEGSNHVDSMYFISEDILQLEEARSLLGQLQLPEELFGTDLFSKFPLSIRPSCALIIGGMGSRSFLHADPYEWTGWNYCFEGEKLWTFLPPETNQDNFLRTKRTPTNAWGEYNIAAGWQSDIDLYHDIVSSEDATSPLNKHWKAAYAAAPSGHRPPYFASSDPVLEQADDLWPLDTANIDMEAAASLQDGDLPSLARGAVQILQREGDLVLIPPGWHHQVYSVSPSVAVAGQYCNEGVRKRVLSHILSWCNATGKEEEQVREQERQRRKVDRLKREGGDDLLGEFYGSGGENDDKSEELSEAIEQNVELPADLHELDDETLVPRLLKLALLARYRREDVAQEIYDEICGD